MSNDIAHILEKYKGQDGATILASPEIGRDIATIGEELSNSSEQDQKEAKAFLKEILSTIENAMNTMKSEMQSNKDSMDHIQKMSDACLAYLKPNATKKG